uniref:D-alanyl-D-alanine carboxypeptidase n=1 Tax=candidate division CPR3 bacterium TaxID=2268181 RepID=A0A7C4M135_UNCC3
MKYIYLLITIIIISSCSAIGTAKVSSAPLIYGESFLIKKGSNFKLLESKTIPKPQLTGIEEEFKAESYIILDRETLTPLLTKKDKDKRLFASVTKLMTVLVALENSDKSKIVEINRDFSDTPPAKMGIYKGEKILLENILKAALILSANDAADMIAYHVGNGNYNSFIDLMNQKAKDIGMFNTHFTNAIGLDDEQNYSTVYDLALLANYALKNEFIAETVKIKELEVYSYDGVTKHQLKSTNNLLDDKEINVYGLKTGQTPIAGGCFVSVAKLKNGEEIITVVLGSDDRFGQTIAMIEWVEENIKWEK